MKISHLHAQSWGVGDYRHWIPARALRRAGHTVWDEPYTDNAFARDGGDGTLDRFLIERATASDLIHVGWCANTTLLEKLSAIREYARQVLQKPLPILTDIDDDVLNVPDYNTGFKAYAAGDAKRVVLLHARISDGLSVTVPRLADLYSPYNDHIDILPNCFDPTDWANLPTDPTRATDRAVRVIFAGGIGRKADLDTIREPLTQLMATRPQVQLLFMGMMPDWAAEWAPSPTDPTLNRAFFIGATDVRRYRRLMCWLRPDITLAPVVQNDFNRGKSDIKVLESGLYGAASICTRWETYKQVPEEATIKCDTPADWFAGLTALVDDTSLRRILTQQCRKWAYDTRTIDGNIGKWERFYEDVLSRPTIGADGKGIKQSQLIIPGVETLQCPS